MICCYKISKNPLKKKKTWKGIKFRSPSNYLGFLYLCNQTDLPIIYTYVSNDHRSHLGNCYPKQLRYLKGLLKKLTCDDNLIIFNQNP